jgi:ABC-type amino acid transport substrate-binding protein
MNYRSPLIILIITASLALGWWVRKTTPPVLDATASLVVGTNAEFPPFTYIDNDHIVGFDIDVITEAAKRMGKTVTLTNMSFDALIPELQLGSIQVIAAGITPTPERAQRVFFTTPYFTGDPLLAIERKGVDPITTAAQLQDKVVVVNQGYTADQWVTNQGIPEIVRLSSPLVSTGLLTLSSGQADVFIAAQSSLRPFLATQQANYTMAPITGTAEATALAVSKHYPELFTQLQTTIDTMINDGTIETLKKKWKLND